MYNKETQLNRKETENHLYRIEKMTTGQIGGLVARRYVQAHSASIL